MNAQSFSAAALTISLREMFNTSKHFNVCTFDNLLTMAGITLRAEEYAPFRALHCVNYANMPSGFKEQLARQCIEVLSRAPDYKIEFEFKVSAKPGFLMEGVKLLK
jgi:hypothetical protein